MSESIPIKLKIPQQDLQAFTLFRPNADGAHHWTQGLPVTDTNALVDLLHRALKDLNRIKLSPESRFEIMKILQPNLQVALTNLARRFLNQPLVMPGGPRQMAQLADELCTLASTAYTIVAVETIQQRDAIRNINPARLTCEAVHHALVFAGLKVLRTFQLYRPLEIHAWHSLHQLYALAEGQQLAELPVPDPMFGGGSIKSTYLQALLLGCCKPNQLRQGDLTALHRGLQEWSELVKLEKQVVNKTLFLVDLSSDQPPLYSEVYTAEPGSHCRYVNTDALLARLRSLKEETGNSGINFEKDVTLPANVLDHLIASLGAMSMRNFKRAPTGGTLQVCVGLSSTHYHVAGKLTFEQVLYGEAYNRAPVGGVDDGSFMTSQFHTDQWQLANPHEDFLGEHLPDDPRQQVNLGSVTMARVLQDESEEIPGARKEYPVYTVQLANASPGGYCLEWDSTLPADIKSGDIIGIRDEDQHDWAIAVIRWLSRLEEARTLMGLELLSPRAVPFGASIHQKDSSKTPPLRALLLPEIKLVGQGNTLVTPRAGFKERQKVTLGDHARAHTVQLKRQLAATGSYAQFDFEFIRELGDLLAEKEEVKLGADLDSLWSNI